MRKTLLLLTLVLLPSAAVAQPGITFTFDNERVVEENGTSFFVFDVEAAASEAGTRLGDTQLYIAYNPEAFGASVVSNDKITVTKGTLLQKQAFGSTPAYERNNVADNTPSRVSILYGYRFASSPDEAAALPTTPTQLVEVRIEIQNPAETAGLRFAEHLMAGNQFLADNTTQYAPVTAIDVTDTRLPVELASFEATVDGMAALLSWETTSETNNAGFELQKQAKTGTWEQVAFVEGTGTTTEAQHYRHRVDELAPGEHLFRLKQVDFDGVATYSAEVNVTTELAGTHRFSPAAPNPFNPRTQFTLTVSKTQPVRAVVYNALGRRVAVLHDGPLAANEPRSFTFEANGLPSGLYLIRVTGETFSDVRRALLVK